MAARRATTERVTVRVPKTHLLAIDDLIAVGEVRNRSQAICDAIRDWVQKKMKDVPVVKQTAQHQNELAELAALKDQLEALLQKHSGK